MRRVLFLFCWLALLPEGQSAAGTQRLHYRQADGQYRLYVTDAGRTRSYPLGPCPFIDTLADAYLRSVHAGAADKRLGFRLYRALFPAGLQPGTQLLIRADGALGRLPFECLVADPSGRYLVERSAFRYALNEADWTDPERLPTAGPPDLLTVNPGLEDSGLPSLPFATVETEAIAALHPGRVIRKSELSKQRFVELAPAFGILHLATHAGTDPGDPGCNGIILRDRGRTDTIFAGEISELGLLRARLLILSTCGNGDSLIQAFRSAGVRNVVASVWPLPDKSGSALVCSFYRHLLDGCDMDRALQRAKIDYLAGADARGSEPCYWAGLVLCGDGSPVDLRPVSPGAVFLFDGLIFLLGGGLFVVLQKYIPARRARRG